MERQDHVIGYNRRANKRVDLSDNPMGIGYGYIDRVIELTTDSDEVALLSRGLRVLRAKRIMDRAEATTDVYTDDIDKLLDAMGKYNLTPSPLLPQTESTETVA
jgi:hypothetical protein